jgi:hypothetical protein
MTLDTNCVIYAAQRGRYASELDELVTMARGGKVSLFLTSAFEVDQERAREPNKRLNLQWLRERPLISRAPQPFRFDFSPLGDPGHVLLGGNEDAELVTKLEEIVLPPRLRPGQFDPTDHESQSKFRRKVADVQHLAGHLISQNDVFVTTDSDDMLKKRDRILTATGIRVVDPPEAVAIAHLG